MGKPGGGGNGGAGPGGIGRGESGVGGDPEIGTVVVVITAAGVEAVVGHELDDLEGAAFAVDVGQGDGGFKVAGDGEGVGEEAVGEYRNFGRILNDRRDGDAVGVLGDNRIRWEFGARIHREGDAVVTGVEDEFVEAELDRTAALRGGDDVGIRSLTAGPIPFSAVIDGVGRWRLEERKVSVQGN